MTDSYIEAHGDGGVSYVGLDAVSLYRATALKSGLRLYAKTGMKPNSAWTPTAMLAAAGGITGKRYKRGQYAAAAADLQIWIDAMRAALPIVAPERGQ